MSHARLVQRYALWFVHQFVQWRLVLSGIFSTSIQSGIAKSFVKRKYKVDIVATYRPFLIAQVASIAAANLVPFVHEAKTILISRIFLIQLFISHLHSRLGIVSVNWQPTFQMFFYPYSNITSSRSSWSSWLRLGCKGHNCLRSKFLGGRPYFCDFCISFWYKAVCILLQDRLLL